MTIQEVRAKYPYLYETHLHTKEGSACAVNSGAEMARAAKEYGYTGIFVTDHHFGGNTRVDRNQPWEEWVDQFCQGYRSAKAEGDRIGLDVFFGYEAGYNATEFLIYGIDEAMMKAHPELKNAGLEYIPKHYELIQELGGMMIHAHPYREEDYIPEIRLFPDCVDGVEGVNATHSNSRSTSHNDPEFDTLAIAYAKKHHFPMTAGSDIHHTGMLGGGVAFTRMLTSAKDFVKAIQSQEDYVLTNGEKWYDKNGKLIAE